MSEKKIIIWTKGVDDFIQGKSWFGGGITVQMYFWAKIFQQNNWQVFSISNNSNNLLEKIRFIKIPSINKIGILTDFIFTCYYIFKIRPQVIFRRGASRNLGFVSFWAKIFNCKVIFLGAHDTDFDIGNELIKYNHDKAIYRYGIKKTDCFIVQNTIQEKRLKSNYCKNNILLIPNIWSHGSIKNMNDFQETNFILWVSNFFNRKRPEWFIQLAGSMPDKKFVMVGGSGCKELFEKCETMAKGRDNLMFLGPKNFQYTTSLFSKANLFICSSEYEGFPNTFLQSWANQVPVISTVDPSNVITKNKLGIVVAGLDDIITAIKELDDSGRYKNIQDNIQKYFNENHDGYNHFNSIVKKFNL